MRKSRGNKDLSERLEQADLMIGGLAARLEAEARDTEDNKRQRFLFEEATTLKLLRREGENSRLTPSKRSALIYNGLYQASRRLATRGEDDLADGVQGIMDTYFPQTQPTPKTRRVLPSVHEEDADTMIDKIMLPDPSPAAAVMAVPAAEEPTKKSHPPALDLSMASRLGSESAAYAAVHQVPESMQKTDKMLGALGQQFTQAAKQEGPDGEFYRAQQARLSKLGLICRQSGQGTEDTALGTVRTELRLIHNALAAKAEEGVDGAASLRDKVKKAQGLLTPQRKPAQAPSSTQSPS